VQCRRCGLAFNGRTGRSNTNGILTCAVVDVLVIVVLLFVAKSLGLP
jgi:hypothetical protein